MRADGKPHNKDGSTIQDQAGCVDRFAVLHNPRYYTQRGIPKSKPQGNGTSRLAPEIRELQKLCVYAIKKADERDGLRAVRYDGPRINASRQAGDAPPGVRMTPTRSRWTERLIDVVAEQARRPLTDQNPLPLLALYQDIQRARFGAQLRSRERLLTEWQGWPPDKIPTYSNAEVRKMRREAGVDPEEGILPILRAPLADAEPEDGRAYIIALWARGMGQTSIAEKIGKSKQYADRVISDYLSS